MSNYGPGIIPIQASNVIDGVLAKSGLPFKDGFNEPSLSESIMRHCPSYRDRVFTPQATMMAWLFQVLSGDKSCRKAVSRVNEDRIASDLKPAASTTNSYCEARSRLPEAFIHEQAYLVGLAIENEAPVDWLVNGRNVKVVDGSTFTMEDTPANQAVYPQHPTQTEGAGFPLARMVAVMSLATGAVIDAAFDAFEGKGTGEHALLRKLIHCFNSGDIALGDAYYGSYFLIARLRSLGVDGIFAIHGARDVDFRRGRRIESGDHIVIWKKPPKPEWMTDDEYALYSDAMVVRESSFNVDIKGFRSKSITVVTTLLDSKVYSKEILADIYRRRWAIEVNLRSIKTTMKMEHIRCRTPDMVKKDFWMHMLAYNLIRKLMAQSAWIHGKNPWQISFKGAAQTLISYKNLWKYEAADPKLVMKYLLDAIGQHVVGNRPDRYEPRVQKRRPKPYPYLKGKRSDARRALA